MAHWANAWLTSSESCTDRPPNPTDRVTPATNSWASVQLRIPIMNRDSTAITAYCHHMSCPTPTRAATPPTSPNCTHDSPSNPGMRRAGRAVYTQCASERARSGRIRSRSRLRVSRPMIARGSAQECGTRAAAVPNVCSRLGVSFRAPCTTKPPMRAVTTR